MRLTSTKASITGGEVTVLAVIETAIAMSLAVIVAMCAHTLFHIGLGAIIAPLLLMRSDRSVAFGRRLYQGFERGVRSHWSGDVFLFAVFFPLFVVASFAIRFVATVRHPIAGLKSIPVNWQKVVICTDVYTAPELVPGIGVILPEHPDKDFKDPGMLVSAGICGLGFLALGWWLSTVPYIFFLGWLFLLWGVLFGLMLGIGALCCVVVAWMYRFGLKSTALLWVPLLYVSKSTFRTDLPQELRIALLRDSALWKLIRIVAWLTIGLFALKVFVLPQVIDWWNSQAWAHVLNVYVMPQTIHMWHLAGVANAAIALTTYYLLIDPAPRMLETGAWQYRQVEWKIQVFTFVRGVISIYTITTGLYLTLNAVRRMPLPVLNFDLWPS
ncbi:MAG: hypothetical protein ACYTG0_33325 [Planctomycetota bacterium]|jgi:hypothetical protein